MNLRPGQAIAQYRLEEPIGAGGMGVVWKAHDTKLNRPVALKFLPPELVQDEERRLRFQREALAAAALDHPGIAVVYETGEHEGAPFLAMQYLAGRTLRERSKAGPMDSREWAETASALAEALAHAHAKGIVHRDLKPENVMLGGEGQVKILDFGLARMLMSDVAPVDATKQDESRLATISRELTRAGKVMGTAAYMSPEQAKGEPADHRSDLFSLGVMLHEMASGTMPFRRKTDVETLAAILNEEPAPMGDRAGIPGEAVRIIHKLLEKEPDRRYQSAADLAADLRNLRRDLDSGRVTAASGRVAAARTPAQEKSRTDLIITFSGMGFALIVVIIVFYFSGMFGGRRDGSSEDPGRRDTPAARAGGSPQAGSLAVVGFQNVTDPGDSQHLGRALMGLVTTDLAESGGMDVVSTARVLSAMKTAGVAAGDPFDASMAPEIAREAGAQTMLVGQVTRAGERILLTAEIVDVASGRTLGSIRQEAGSSEELFALAGAIADGVRRQTGASAAVRAAGGFALAEALTSSPQAYGYYVSGEQSLHHGEWQRAIPDFRRAVDEDPTFALAYYKLALAQWWNDDFEGAKATLRSGLEHAERLPRRWEDLYRAFLDVFEQKRDAAYAALEKLTTSGIDSPDPYYILGELSVHLSRYQNGHRARALLERALEIDPGYTIALRHLIETMVSGGDFEAAERLLSSYLESDPDDPMALRSEALLRSAQGRQDEARPILEKIYESSGGVSSWNDLSMLLIVQGDFDRAEVVLEEAGAREIREGRGEALALRARLRMVQGRFREAMEDLIAAGRIYASQGQASWNEQTHVSTMVARALILQRMGRPEEGEQLLREAAVWDSWYAPPQFWLGRHLLEQGSRDRAEEVHRHLARLAGESASPRPAILRDLLGVELAVAAGDHGKAARLMEGLESEPVENRDRLLEAMVRARMHEATGDMKAAAAAWETVITPATIWGSFNLSFSLEQSLLRAEAFYHLGRAREATGDSLRAREAYRRFLDLWGDADFDLPEVDEALKRLSALGG